MLSARGMRLLAHAVPPVLASAAFWSAFACFEPPAFDAPTGARIVVLWDPTTCEGSRRVAIELADEDGAPLSASAPCRIGSLTIEAPHLGVYQGRVYAWIAGEPIRSEMPVRLVVDEPIVRWQVATPA